MEAVPDERDPILDRILREDFDIEPDDAPDDLKEHVRGTFRYQARKLDAETRTLGLVGRKHTYEMRHRLARYFPSLFGPRGDDGIE